MSEINDTLAVEVMGWELIPETPLPFDDAATWKTKNGNYILCSEWQPNRKLEQAKELLVKLNKEAHITFQPNSDWLFIVEIEKWKGKVHASLGISDNLAEAITWAVWQYRCKDG